MRLGRVATITLSIAAIGAIIGGALGAGLFVVALAARIGMREAAVLDAALFGASAGAALGAVLAPITAWAFLRRVPLGRAIAQTAIGTTLGAAIGIALGNIQLPGITTLPWGLIGALLGFVVASIRLRLGTADSRKRVSRDAGVDSGEKL